MKKPKIKSFIAVSLICLGFLVVLGAVGGTEKETMEFGEFCFSIILGLACMFGGLFFGKKSGWKS